MSITLRKRIEAGGNGPLESPQQLALGLEIHPRDFVQQQRAALGRAEQAEVIDIRAAEGAAFVAEELALDQIARYRRTIHRHERCVWIRPSLVNGGRREVLASATLADNEDRAMSRAGGFDRIVDPSHRRARAKQAMKVSSFGGLEPASVVLELFDSDG